jgi:hypothetical protein
VEGSYLSSLPVLSCSNVNRLHCLEIKQTPTKLTTQQPLFSAAAADEHHQSMSKEESHLVQLEVKMIFFPLLPKGNQQHTTLAMFSFSSPSRAAAATISEVHSPILIHVKVIGEHEVHPICLSADGMCNTSLWTHDKQPKVSIGNVEVTVGIKLEPKWPSTDVLILQGSRLPIAHTGPVQYT